jgi:arylformamidase
MTRGRRGAAWYDTQYNSRARIPEHPAILQSWAERSAAARARMQGRLDQPYGLGDREAMDLFLPERPGAQAAPVLVWIHGGYWRALDKQAQSFVAEPYVAAGALVAVPGYALCPGVTVEHIVRQLVRALAWLHARLPRYGADPRRLVVAGHSAGAQLAAMLLLCRWREVDTRLPDRLACGGLALSGVFDLEPLRHAPFLAADLALSRERARRLSPLRLPAPAVPLHAYVGAEESAAFVAQSRRLATAWGPGAVPVCRSIEGRHHMGMVDEMVRPASPVQASARQLLGLPPSPSAAPA